MFSLALFGPFDPDPGRAPPPGSPRRRSRRLASLRPAPLRAALGAVPTFETPGHVKLDLIVPAGAVTVGTWGEPRVEISVTPIRGDDASVQAAAETRIEAVERGGRHEVSVRVPKREGRLGIFGRSPELLVAIRCPEGSRPRAHDPQRGPRRARAARRSRPSGRRRAT